MPLTPASSETGFFKSRELSPKYDPAAIGLAFSGGGYRATLFHAGAMLRLNELGILGKASRITSVSGGSITTGIMAMNWDKIAWNDGKATHEEMVEHLIQPCIDATSLSIDVAVSAWGLVPGISAGNKLAATYDKHIFNDKKINTITEQTRFIFCASNLQTGGLYRFNRHYMADYRALMSTTKQVKLSEAVAASSGFPPILAPLRLDLSGEEVTLPEGARFDDPKLRVKPVLADGGLYDNIGLEPIWKRCGILVASNAGRNNPAMAKRFTVGMMVRIINTYLDISIDWRERTLVSLYRNILNDNLPERRGAYWTIATGTKNLAWDGWKATDAQREMAQNMATRLKKFDRATQKAAILSGYSYADGAARAYLVPEADAPTAEPLLP